MRLLFGLGSLSMYSIPADWCQGLAARGHEVRAIPSSGGITLFVREFSRAVASFRPDVVHLHHTGPALAGAFLKSKVPCVLTVHRNFKSMSASAKAAHAVAATRVDAVVTNSLATLESIPMHLRNRISRIMTIYNGVDCSRLAVPQYSACRHPDNLCRIVSVGRLIPEKDFESLLIAVRLVLDRGVAPFRLTVVGSGCESDRLERLRVQLALTNVVTFKGALPREDVYRHLAEADLFVLASRTEGFCNAVVEAMAAGLPVVVTPADALCEVVGDSGWVAADFGHEALADALESALRSSAATRRSIGIAARQRAEACFSLTRTLRQYEELYEEISS